MTESISLFEKLQGDLIQEREHKSIKQRELRELRANIEYLRSRLGALRAEAAHLEHCGGGGGGGGGGSGSADAPAAPAFDASDLKERFHSEAALSDAIHAFASAEKSRIAPVEAAQSRLQALRLQAKAQQQRVQTGAGASRLAALERGLRAVEAALEDESATLVEEEHFLQKESAQLEKMRSEFPEKRENYTQAAKKAAQQRAAEVEIAEGLQLRACSSSTSSSAAAAAAAAGPAPPPPPPNKSFREFAEASQGHVIHPQGKEWEW